MSLMYSILRRNFNENGITNDNKILDVGCGNGDLVNFMRQENYDAFGIDLEFKDGKHTSNLLSHGILKEIDIGDKNRSGLDSGDKYIWPEFNFLFDVIVTRAVIEHVRNLEEFVNSSKSILQKGGICIHYFPSKYSIIEPHIGVPFGAVFTNKTWIKLMCFFGLCFSTYRGNGEEAYQYMVKSTTYRRQSEIDMLFKEAGFQRIKSIGPLQCNPKKILKFLDNIFFVNYLFSIFRSRVIVYKLI
jgi:2-polyprenyl-3-methyl-5-hydroxy-6-metoxy-1,4-benzoquinol methylase